MVKTHADSATINLDYLEMMTGGDLEMRQMMLKMILVELPTEIEKMRPLVEAKLWNELKEISHKMKSTLAFVGNDQMTFANRDIESICKSLNGTEDLPSLVETLENLLIPILKELEAA